METSKTPTPLLAWLRKAEIDEQHKMAELAGTTRNYLFQLAGCHRGVPKADLALKIEDATRNMHAQTGGRLPIVTVRELATMCASAECPVEP